MLPIVENLNKCQTVRSKQKVTTTFPIFALFAGIGTLKEIAEYDKALIFD